MDTIRHIRDTLIRDTRRGVGYGAQTPRLIPCFIPHTFSGVTDKFSKQHYTSQPKNSTALFNFEQKTTRWHIKKKEAPTS